MDEKQQQANEARKNEELYQRKKAGAKGQLWSVALVYNYDMETKRHMLKNLFTNELMKFRETVITAGAMIPTREEKGEYIVILPWHIISITVTRQSRFFDP